MSVRFNRMLAAVAFGGLASAALAARRAGVRELALTHVWPTFDPQISLEEARAEAGGLPVRWARSGEVFEVGG